MNQKYVTEKNRKLKRMRELYPAVNVRIVYKKDLGSLVERFKPREGRLMDESNFVRIAFSREAIEGRVREIGKKISADYAGKELVLVGVLKGSAYFLADLSRSIDIPHKIDFISIGVYQGTNKTGVVRITKDLDIDVFGKHVLIIEDIVRTGLTTGYLFQNIEARVPDSIKVCTLLVNPDQQLISFPIAYTGFTVTDEWLAGYGMDIDEQWRGLPYIAEVKRTKEHV